MLPITKSKLILIAAFIVYAVSAFFNNGYYYYDEHYQIIEFAELKAGNNNPKDLAWEYNAKVRPALQPAIAYVFLSVMRWVGVEDHYLLMTLLRLLTAFIALIIITFFIKKTQHLIRDNLIVWYKLMAYFLWFLPFINIRFSSESFSGLFFLLGIALLYSNSKFKYLLIGCVLALSFLLRFQTALMSLGFILWLIFIYKAGANNLLKLFSGGLLIICLGFIIDYWLYGIFTLPFHNYYVFNIINGVASKFGVSPWYSYFFDSSNASIFLVGIIIWACLIYQFVFNYKNFICWIILPFLLVHIIIPHKELRFLFPIVNLIPLFIILTIQDLLRFNFSNKWIQIFLKASLVMIIFINTIALAITMLLPADGSGKMIITQTIHNTYKSRPVILWTVGVFNPYKPVRVPQKFYLDKNVSVKKIDFANLPHFKQDSTNLILINTAEIANCDYILAPYHLKKIKSTVPEWITGIKNLLNYDDPTLTLYEAPKL